LEIFEEEYYNGVRSGEGVRQISKNPTLPARAEDG
jgi:hypothetical protein